MKRIANLGVLAILLLALVCISSAWLRSYFRHDDVTLSYILIRGQVVTFGRITHINVTSGLGAVCLNIGYASSGASQAYRESVQDIFPALWFDSRDDRNDRPRGFCFNDQMPALARWFGLGGEISNASPAIWPHTRYQLACPYWLLAGVAAVVLSGSVWKPYAYLVEIKSRIFKGRGFDVP
ncbi:MAG: hypothetical protein QM754_19335 [Tepidisphaeraceae bacterium]